MKGLNTYAINKERSARVFILNKPVLMTFEKHIYIFINNRNTNIKLNDDMNRNYNIKLIYSFRTG